jgi:hypothetical protein
MIWAIERTLSNVTPGNDLAGPPLLLGLPEFGVDLLDANFFDFPFLEGDFFFAAFFGRASLAPTGDELV